MTFSNQTLAKMRTEKSGAARDQYASSQMHEIFVQENETRSSLVSWLSTSTSLTTKQPAQRPPVSQLLQVVIQRALSSPAPMRSWSSLHPARCARGPVHAASRRRSTSAKLPSSAVSNIKGAGLDLLLLFVCFSHSGLCPKLSLSRIVLPGFVVPYARPAPRFGFTPLPCRGFDPGMEA